jgi:hypothetical protein
MTSGAVLGCTYRLVQDLYIIQINGFSTLMDDAHKMIAGRELWGTPHEIEGLLVEAIGLIINEYRHRPESLPALACSTMELKRFVRRASITCRKLQCIHRRKTRSWSRLAI